MDGEITGTDQVRPVVLYGLVLLASILLPLSLPNEIFPYGNPALGFVAIAPVFVAVTLAPSFGFASKLGVVFGGLSTALANYWLMFFQNFSVWTMGGVVVGYMGYNALLFPLLRGFSRVAARFRPFVLAMAWALYEYLKSIGFLGYPWELVAYPLGSFLPLAQFIDTTGIWGLSFLAALCNALVAEWALAGHRLASPFALVAQPYRSRAAWLPLLGRQTGFAVLLAGLALGYGFWKLSEPRTETRSIRMLLVQQNINPWDFGKLSANSTRVNEELTLAGLSDASERIDLVAWSETSVTDTVVTPDKRLLPPDSALPAFMRRAGVPVITGGIVVVDPSRDLYMNSAVLLAPDGSVVDTYGKMHPVPFAESIPFFEWEPVRWFFTNVVHVWAPWQMGTRRTLFRVQTPDGPVAFGAPICFEDAFSDLCRRFVLEGADLWVNLTNDYWSRTVSSEYQHFQVAMFRAIENRRPLVRSTNGGVTAVVDARGRVIASLPLFERDYEAVQVPLERGSLTLYTRLGDWFPWTLAAALLALLVWGVLPAGRRAEKNPGSSPGLHARAPRADQ